MTSFKTNTFPYLLAAALLSVNPVFASEVTAGVDSSGATPAKEAQEQGAQALPAETAPLKTASSWNADQSAVEGKPAVKGAKSDKSESGNKSDADVADDDQDKPAKEIKKKKKSSNGDEDEQVAAEEKMPTTEELDPVPHYEKALAYINEKKYFNAEKELNLALDRNNYYYDAWLKLALIYELTGRRKAAIREYKEILSVKPELVEAHINLGTLLRQENDFDGASEQYQKAIALNYYLEEAHYNLGNVLAASGKLEPALKEFQTCLKLEKAGSEQTARVHNNIGVIYQKRNYLEDAQEEFLKALRMEPGNKTFEANLAIVRKQLNLAPVGAFKGGHQPM